MRRLALALVFLVVLTGCGSGPPAQKASTAEERFLDRHGLADRTAAEVVDALDRVPPAQRSEDLMASVRPDELVLSDERSEVSMPMPKDDFYVSVAPYVRGTHDCFHHSLTTCRGELGNRRVQLRVTDSDGEVLLRGRRNTFANGFVGFWLPRDIDFTLEVRSDGKVGSVDSSTRPDSPTCLTTLRLT